MKKNLLVSIVMGSQSDWKILSNSALILNEFKIPFEKKIVSAHRTPERLYEYAKSLKIRKIEIVIAGAGGAAHLPGMIAACSPLPVIGVPIKSSNSIDGWDSILSILQMPNGVPVATVALNGAKNAAILAIQILGCSNEKIRNDILNFKKEQENKVLNSLKK